MPSLLSIQNILITRGSNKGLAPLLPPRLPPCPRSHRSNKIVKLIANCRALGITFAVKTGTAIYDYLPPLSLSLLIFPGWGLWISLAGDEIVICLAAAAVFFVKQALQMPKGKLPQCGVQVSLSGCVACSGDKDNTCFIHRARRNF